MNLTSVRLITTSLLRVLKLPIPDKNLVFLMFAHIATISPLHCNDGNTE